MSSTRNTGALEPSLDMVIEYMENLIKEAGPPHRPPSPSFDEGSGAKHEDSSSDGGAPPLGEEVQLLDRRTVNGEVEFLVAEAVQECTYAQYRGFRNEGYKIRRAPAWRTRGGVKTATVHWRESWIGARYLDFPP